MENNNKKRFWYEEDFIPSEKSKILIFDRKQFLFLFLYFSAALAMGFLLKKASYAVALTTIRSWAMFAQTVMAVRIFNHIRIGDFTLKKELPIHLCNINIIFISIFVWTLSEKLFDFIYTYAMIGALAAMLIPDSDGGRYPRFSFKSLEFYFSHTTLTFLPVYIKFYLGIPYRMSNMRFTLLLFAVVALGDFLLNSRLGSNYFFVSHAPDGSPAVKLEEKYGSLVYRILYVLCMTAICFVMHLVLAS